LILVGKCSFPVKHFLPVEKYLPVKKLLPVKQCPPRGELPSPWLPYVIGVEVIGRKGTNGV
jgi:hypothetical protein